MHVCTLVYALRVFEAQVALAVAMAHGAQLQILRKQCTFHNVEAWAARDGIHVRGALGLYARALASEQTVRAQISDAKRLRLEASETARSRIHGLSCSRSRIGQLRLQIDAAEVESEEEFDEPPWWSPSVRPMHMCLSMCADMCLDMCGHVLTC